MSENTAGIRLKNLESHYRPCACRSTTPFFSDTLHKDELAHGKDTDNRIFRTRFQHDRDKILYSQSFRRLRLKSQIFPEHTADLLRTRLDHSLEVAQIARHLARQLQLNEDLVDAIAFGHDLGHAPFAHSGERALHRFLVSKKIDGFRHNWQGLRVVDKLDKSYPEHEGLNLSRSVRLGILLHTSLKYKNLPGTCQCNLGKSLRKEMRPRTLDDNSIWCLEIQVAALADEIAQIIHDLEDALVSRSVDLESVVRQREHWPLVSDCLDSIEDKASQFTTRSGHSWPNVAEWQDLKTFPFADDNKTKLLVSRIRSHLIYLLTHDVIDTSLPKLDAWEKQFGTPHQKLDLRIRKFDKFVEGRNEFDRLVDLGSLREPQKALKDKLHESVVRSERVSRMDGKADYVIRHILEVYLKDPRQAPQTILDQYANAKGLKKDVRKMPDKDLKNLELRRDKDYIRGAVDYVAGMTDRYALREYDQLYSAYPRTEL